MGTKSHKEVLSKIDPSIYYKRRGEYVRVDMEDRPALVSVGEWGSVTHYASGGMHICHCNNISLQPVRIVAGMEEKEKILLLRLPNRGATHVKVVGPNQSEIEKQGEMSIYSLGPDVSGISIESASAGVEDVVNVILTLESIVEATEDTRLAEEILKNFFGNTGSYISSLKSTPILNKARAAIVSNPYTGTLSEYYVKSIIYEVLAELFRCLDGDVKTDGLRGARERAKILNACDILEANLHNPPPVEVLAKDAGMSRTKFNDVFRSVTGHTVFGWVVQKRLDVAMVQLQRGGISLKKLSHSLGYTHQSAFTAAFRNRFGVSPSAFLAVAE